LRSSRWMVLAPRDRRGRSSIALRPIVYNIIFRIVYNPDLR
jgi:hypothetical protein